MSRVRGSGDFRWGRFRARIGPLVVRHRVGLVPLTRSVDGIGVRWWGGDGVIFFPLEVPIKLGTRLRTIQGLN